MCLCQVPQQNPSQGQQAQTGQQQVQVGAQEPQQQSVAQNTAQPHAEYVPFDGQVRF